VLDKSPEHQLIMGQSSSTRGEKSKEEPPSDPNDPPEQQKGEDVTLNRPHGIFGHIAELFSSTQQRMDPEILSLRASNWRSDTPSLRIVEDDTVSMLENQIFQDSLHPDGYLDFRLRMPENYLGGKLGLHRIAQCLVQSTRVLGITAIYFEKGAEKFLKKLKRSRPQWSEVVRVFGCKILWAKDFSQANGVIIRVHIDKDDSSVVTVNTADDIYIIDLGSDVVSSFFFLCLKSIV
jgi:hypothetical protein